MISADAFGRPPFTVVVNTSDGHTRTFPTMEQAQVYTSRLLNVLNVTSETFNAAGQMVGSTETFIDGNVYDDGPSAA